MKCNHCGKKVVRYPIRDGGGNLIVKNLFKMDIQSILLIIVIIAMVMGYKADIAKCNDAIERPCVFCAKSNCCQEDFRTENLETAIYRNLNAINISAINK